ncbi:unnamed protein product [Paramecium sonneborni]|uniref:Uncharacterized protein n=1 Tax=Paramecium sonneborni TaxID=65129 RepID=A0A8S1RPC3_9CILI|nr:unnamed protein product [Paramecium sonneborni]
MDKLKIMEQELHFLYQNVIQYFIYFIKNFPKANYETFNQHICILKTCKAMQKFNYFWKKSLKTFWIIP